MLEGVPAADRKYFNNIPPSYREYYKYTWDMLTEFEEPAKKIDTVRDSNFTLNVDMEFHKKTDKPLMKRFATKVADQISKITRSHQDYAFFMTEVINKLLAKHDTKNVIIIKEGQFTSLKNGQRIWTDRRTR